MGSMYTCWVGTYNEENEASDTGILCLTGTIKDENGNLRPPNNEDFQSITIDGNTYDLTNWILRNDEKHYANRKGLKYIIIIGKESSQSFDIPNQCFQGCTDLLSIKTLNSYPGKLGTIGDRAFKQCDNIFEIDINNPAQTNLLRFYHQTFDNAYNAIKTFKINIPHADIYFGDQVIPNLGVDRTVDISAKNIIEIKCNNLNWSDTGKYCIDTSDVNQVNAQVQLTIEANNVGFQKIPFFSSNIQFTYGINISNPAFIRRLFGSRSQIVKCSSLTVIPSNNPIDTEFDLGSFGWGELEIIFEDGIQFSNSINLRRDSSLNRINFVLSVKSSDILYNHITWYDHTGINPSYFKERFICIRDQEKTNKKTNTFSDGSTWRNFTYSTFIPCPDNITKVPDYFLNGVSGITLIELGNNIKNIGKLAYANLSQINFSYKASNLVLLKDNNIFENSILTEIEIHSNKVQRLPSFIGSSKNMEIKLIKFNDNEETSILKEIADEAFNLNSSTIYEEIILPYSIERIGNNSLRLIQGKTTDPGIIYLKTTTQTSQLFEIGQDAFGGNMVIDQFPDTLCEIHNDCGLASKDIEVNVEGLLEGETLRIAIYYNSDDTQYILRKFSTKTLAINEAKPEPKYWRCIMPVELIGIAERAFEVTNGFVTDLNGEANKSETHDNYTIFWDESIIDKEDEANNNKTIPMLLFDFSAATHLHFISSYGLYRNFLSTAFDLRRIGYDFRGCQSLEYIGDYAFCRKKNRNQFIGAEINSFKYQAYYIALDVTNLKTIYINSIDFAGSGNVKKDIIDSSQGYISIFSQIHLYHADSASKALETWLTIERKKSASDEQMMRKGSATLSLGSTEAISEQQFKGGLLYCGKQKETSISVKGISVGDPKNYTDYWQKDNINQFVINPSDNIKIEDGNYLFMCRNIEDYYFNLDKIDSIADQSISFTGWPCDEGDYSVNPTFSIIFESKRIFTDNKPPQYQPLVIDRGGDASNIHEWCGARVLKVPNYAFGGFGKSWFRDSSRHVYHFRVDELKQLAVYQATTAKVRSTVAFDLTSLNQLQKLELPTLCPGGNITKFCNSPYFYVDIPGWSLSSETNTQSINDEMYKSYFEHLPELTHLILFDENETLLDRCFYYFNNKKDLIIDLSNSENLKKICQNAFSYSALKTLYLPANIKEIAPNSFDALWHEQADELDPVKYYYKNSVKQWLQINFGEPVVVVLNNVILYKNSIFYSALNIVWYYWNGKEYRDLNEDNNSIEVETNGHNDYIQYNPLAFSGYPIKKIVFNAPLKAHDMTALQHLELGVEALEQIEFKILSKNYPINENIFKIGDIESVYTQLRYLIFNPSPNIQPCSIPEYCFANIQQQNLSIILPENVQELLEHSFANCRSPVGTWGPDYKFARLQFNQLRLADNCGLGTYMDVAVSDEGQNIVWLQEETNNLYYGFYNNGNKNILLKTICISTNENAIKFNLTQFTNLQVVNLKSCDFPVDKGFDSMSVPWLGCSSNINYRMPAKALKLKSWFTEQDKKLNIDTLTIGNNANKLLFNPNKIAEYSTDNQGIFYNKQSVFDSINMNTLTISGEIAEEVANIKHFGEGQETLAHMTLTMNTIPSYLLYEAKEDKDNVIIEELVLKEPQVIKQLSLRARQINSLKINRGDNDIIIEDYAFLFPSDLINPTEFTLQNNKIRYNKDLQDWVSHIIFKGAHANPIRASKSFYTEDKIEKTLALPYNTIGQWYILNDYSLYGNYQLNSLSYADSDITIKQIRNNEGEYPIEPLEKTYGLIEIYNGTNDLDGLESNRYSQFLHINATETRIQTNSITDNKKEEVSKYDI